MSFTNNSANKRVAKNTGLLYIRTFFTMIVSFYTSRVILNVLGVTDFGIWNVVAGFVSMFAIFTSSLIAAIQRFFTVELEKNDEDSLRRIFSASVIILLLISGLVLLLAETFGVWVVNTYLDLGEGRKLAANIVFQSSIFCFILSLINIPYSACIIANERMSVFAYISIFEVVLKLLLVICLQFFMYDKLIMFALFTLFVSLVVQIIYRIYSKYNFSYTKVLFIRDKKLYRSMIGFASWSFIGHSAQILMGQGINILFNQFFGLVLNAARGIAVQLENAVYSFVMNFTMAIVPQITKSYAKGDYVRMCSLIIKGANFSYYLMWFFALPILLETDTILSIWLNNYPDYSVTFVRLSLIICLCKTFSNTLESAINATGQIKYYQIIVGGINLFIIPICYIFFKLGFEPVFAYWIIICFNFITVIIKAVILSRLTTFNAFIYFRKVLGVSVLISFISVVPPIFFYIMLEASVLRLFIVGVVSVISVPVTVYCLGLERKEKQYVVSMICSQYKRITKNNHI